MCQVLVGEWAAVLEAFAPGLRAGGLSEKSIESYRGQVERLAAWYEKNRGGEPA
ncbi:MAG TPA: hypothetical protein GX513_10615 [Firmicutes bacterium]|nr:hypothetical protein [Bacillota bacterium]